MTPKRRKRRGESVPSPEQDKAEVVRAVLTMPVDPDVVPTHGDVIVSEGSGDEVLRGEDVVAHNRCQPTAPLRPGPVGSCLVTAIDCTKP